MKIAEGTYRQVIENALSAVESVVEDGDTHALKYLTDEWYDYARSVRDTWEDEENNHPKRVI